jgi:hypothetical protein
MILEEFHDDLLGEVLRPWQQMNVLGHLEQIRVEVSGCQLPGAVL